jgi:hypothetical protein
MHLQLEAVFAGEGVRSRHPRNETAVEDFPAEPDVTKQKAPGFGAFGVMALSNVPACGPETRITATPDGKAPDESATIVSPARIVGRP